MKAIVWPKYGSPDVLLFREVEKPVPKENEVLIKVYAATVTAGDCEIRRFDIAIFLWLFVRIMIGIKKPRKNILGLELAGEIESAGKNVTQFKKGDPVLFSNVQSLSFTYYDTEGETFDHWDSDDESFDVSTPAAIGIQLEFGENTGDGVFETTVYLPVYRRKVEIE